MPVITGFTHLVDIELTCKQCQGKCWNEDQSKRQAAVRSKFGKPLPNKCVDDENGTHRCPFRPQ